MYGTKNITKRGNISPKRCCTEPHENPTSRPQNDDPTVQNVGLDVAKLLTKNHDDPTVQSPGNEGFLKLGIGVTKMKMVLSLFLCSLFFQNMATALSLCCCH
jgi:hypothetical protein